MPEARRSSIPQASMRFAVDGKMEARAGLVVDEGYGMVVASVVITVDVVVVVGAVVVFV